MLFLPHKILIEPQWNVDVDYWVVHQKEHWNFNRTIVECRLIWRMEVMTMVKILIEPQWNVDFDKVGNNTTHNLNFNRTIVECR